MVWPRRGGETKRIILIGPRAQQVLAKYPTGDPNKRIFPYRVDSYDRAIARAAKKTAVRHWHPNQLRHCRASEVAAIKDLETASQVLGNPSAIRVYVEPDLAKAEEVIRQTG